MDPGPGGKVAHRLGHEDLARASQREDASGDVNRDPRQVGALDLAFAGVDSAAHLEMQSFDAVADGPRRPDRGRGGVEPCEEAVSDRLDLTAPVDAELSSHQCVMLVEE